MRITTQMLNESARKAGLPVNQTSLLNYINNKGQSNSLMEALNKRKENTTDAIQKNGYEKLDKEADTLAQAAEILLKESETNVFEQAKENGDNQKVYESIETFFENYNSTLKELSKTNTTLNNFYSEMLSESHTEVKEILSEVGVTFSKDGTAKIDKEKLKMTDLETLENVLGKDSEFVKKVDFISTRISDYAKTNIKSISNAYHADGNLYSAMANSRYDLWG